MTNLWVGPKLTGNIRSYFMLFNVEKPKLGYEEFRMFKKKDLAIAIALAMSVSQIGLGQEAADAPAAPATAPAAAAAPAPRAVSLPLLLPPSP